MIFTILKELWEDPVGGFFMRLGIVACVWNVIYFFTFRRWHKEIMEKREKEILDEFNE